MSVYGARQSSTSVILRISEISDFLYLSGARAVNPRSLSALGIGCVVNATVELPHLPVDGVEFVKVNVDDSPFAVLSDHFDRVADAIERFRLDGVKTLVLCVAGVSRSSSLCIAYLVKYGQMTLRQAYEHVKAKRPIIRPNNGFFRQLIDYERKLHQRNTVSMVASSVGLIPDVYEQEYRNLALIAAAVQAPRSPSTSGT